MAINGFHTSKVMVTDSWSRLSDDSTIVVTGNILIRVDCNNKDIIWVCENNTTKIGDLVPNSPFPLFPGDMFTMKIRHPYDLFVITKSNKDHILWWMTV